MSGSSFNVLPARGVYRSTNALSVTPTFTLVPIQTVTNRSVSDMAMDPGSVNTIVVNVFGVSAAGDGGIWVSTSLDPWAGTAVWTQEITKQAIGRLAVNRSGSTPATTFFATFDEASGCPSGAGGTMSKSIDGGVTWTAVAAARGFCGGQCFYDMATAVDPTDVNKIYLAGSAGGSTGTCNSGIMGKSIDGGTSFTPSQNFLHADSHATATEFTAQSIAKSIPKRGGIRELIASGGGVHNQQIMQRLAELLPDLDIKTSADFGIDPDAKEAIAFAVLAYELVRGRPGNLPSATGARNAVLLGKSSPA
jgi:hypothetical protein